MTSSFPTVIPMLAYENGIKAMEWLAKAFGFVESTKMVENGVLVHGEMIAGNGLIMLATPTPDYQSPKHHRESCKQAEKWSKSPWIIDGVLVYVNDLESHFKQAKASGGNILSEIETGDPGKRYRVEDLEGHRWFFFEQERE